MRVLVLVREKLFQWVQLNFSTLQILSPFSSLHLLLWNKNPEKELERKLAKAKYTHKQGHSRSLLHSQPSCVSFYFILMYFSGHGQSLSLGTWLEWIEESTTHCHCFRVPNTPKLQFPTNFKHKKVNHFTH